MTLQFFNDFIFYPKVTFPPIRNRFVKGTLYEVFVNLTGQNSLKFAIGP